MRNDDGGREEPIRCFVWRKWRNVGPIYRSNVESSSKVDKRHQKCEKSYVAAEC